MTGSPQPELSPRTLSILASAGETRVRQGLLKDRRLLRSEVIAELNAATQRELHIDTERALRLADCATYVAATIGRQDLWAHSLRLQANVLTVAGKYRAALALYTKALAMFGELRESEGAARTLTAMIQSRIMLGEYQFAFAAAKRAKKILSRLKDPRRLARLDNNIGNIYHRQDRFREALTHYERAHRRLVRYGDSEELTIALNNMSMCLIGMNDFAGAVNAHERARRLLSGRELPRIRLINDYNIAYLYYLRGDYSNAIQRLQYSKKQAEEIGYGYLIALCDLDLSDIYVELNLSAEARDVANAAHQRFTELAIPYEAAKSRANEAIALGQLGETDCALNLFAEARAFFVRENNSVWPWLIDLYCALVLTDLGRCGEAQRLAQKAVSRFRGKSLQGKAALCHLVLAQLDLRAKRTKDAAAHCQRALKLLKTFDSPILEFEASFLNAEIARARNQVRVAYRACQSARIPLENLRSSLARDELKIAFMKDKAKLYERLVELCLAKAGNPHSTKEAFNYIELAKSRSLADFLSRRGQVLPPSERSRHAEKLRGLREDLSWYQHRIESEQLKPDANSEQRIEKLQKNARASEKQLLRALRDARDETETIGLSAPNCVSTNRIMSSLRCDESLLEYFVADGQLMAAVLTSKSIKIVPLTTLARVTRVMRFLRFQLGKLQLGEDNRAAPEADERATLSHLRDLHDELIAPVHRQLCGAHLTIIPHGVLHHLPFHCLNDGESYLIDRYTVSYAPSASIYNLCQAEAAHKGSGSLIMGCPDERAPQIEREVRLVQSVLPESELLLGERASREAFFSKAMGKQLIHVASHGTFRPDNPMFSGFRLSNGHVYLYELYRLRICADLLTLSGCSTGLNEVAEGDELIGLIRGALFAGARSVLLSLWEVSDKTTAHFMASFYRRLSEENSKAVAFALAAKDVRAAHPHPYYWAPFILVGKVL